MSKLELPFKDLYQDATAWTDLYAEDLKGVEATNDSPVGNQTVTIICQGEAIRHLSRGYATKLWLDLTDLMAQWLQEDMDLVEPDPADLDMNYNTNPTE